MHLPSIPLGAWWSIAIAATVIFLVAFLPIMPSQGQKLKIYIAPAAGAGTLIAFALTQGRSIDSLLPLYSAMMLAFPLGLVGHRAEMKKRLLDRAENGPAPENTPSLASTVQLLLALFACGALALIYVNR